MKSEKREGERDRGKGPLRLRSAALEGGGKGRKARSGIEQLLYKVVLLNRDCHKRWLTGGFCDMGTRAMGGGTNFMPIYEYQADNPDKGCKLCREGFEYIQRIDEKPLSHCLDCGKRVRKIISSCHAAVIDPSPEHTRVERKITEYEKEGLYSHAAELADKHSHKSKDRLLKERALENYKKAGHNLDSTPKIDT